MMNRQQYLLACLSEELCEVGQEVGKCQRFTPHHKPQQYPETNYERLLLELADLEAIRELLTEAGLDMGGNSEAFAKRKEDKKRRTVEMMEISRDLGVIA